MKQVKLIILFLLAAAVACQKDRPVPSAEDTRPSPEAFAGGKDVSVDPGDSFFDYCNGAWLKKQDPHPARNIGGLYDGEIVMQQRVEQLKQTVPDIGRFYQLLDNIYTQPEKELAFINAKKAAVKKPESKEEAFRTIGKMVAEGAPFSSISFYLLWDMDQLKGVLVPPMSAFNADEVDNDNLIPLTATKATVSQAVTYIVEGMGMNPDLFMTDPEMDFFWEELWNMSLDEIYEFMLGNWDYLQMYATEVPGTTKEKVQSRARATLSYTLSYHLIQQFFPQSLKDKYVGITKEIQASLRKRIEKADWMSTTTKQNALDKLDNYGLFVGYPDQWYTDCVATYDGCETLSEAVCRNNRGISKLMGYLMGGSDVFSYYITQSFINSNNEMQSSDLTLVNAMYSPNYNCVLIYPAVLLPPIMPDEGVSEAFQYATFVIIGHEFTHGFDTQGSAYDKYGRRHNWWTVADKMNFDDRKQNIINCYDKMPLDEGRDPSAYGDGERTQTENIADLGGFLTALDAYKAHLEAQGFTGENYKEQLRKFYEGFAYSWRVQYNDTKFNILVKSDIHSHARLRVNGVVMNTDLWYELYDVNRDNILYLPPERRTYIW
jgi:predicted metalloendopeptidase